MSTSASHLVHHRTPLPAATRTAQVIAIVPLGLMVGVAAVVFTIAAPPSSLSLGDWAVAAWAIVIALVNIVAGIGLGRGSETARRALVGVAVAHIAFGVVKLVAYDESEAMAFLALDTAVIALLARKPFGWWGWLRRSQVPV